MAPAQSAFLDTLQERTFRFFWDLSDPNTGLTPDRWPTQSFVSVSATGFALTAYPIGVEHGWVDRTAAGMRVLKTLTFFYTARMDTVSAGATGYRGFFYHFLDPKTGHRFRDVELSTIDTALLLAGALFCQSYFDGPDPLESQIRILADSLYHRADFQWALVRAPMLVHGWDPENGFLAYDWRGYNESMILPILALASPTRPVGREVWNYWDSGCQWGTFEGLGHVGFAPLFGHQFSHVWLDLRGIRDSVMGAHDMDWFENSRRATYAQRSYARRNPQGFRGYGERLWGLTACDGPMDGEAVVDGRKRAFHTYAARGASFREVIDDGTVAPTAAAGSIAFAPEIVVPALMAMRRDYGPHLFRQYGFVDALNPTLRDSAAASQGGVVPGVGWFDSDYLGIDQGPIVAMIENYRTGLVWRTMRRNPHIVRGLRAAGFTGGWLDSLKAAGR
ncbi:MAG: Tat pathway signal protein [Candidatus Eisenbacteria bacterium]|nr:Tat pathway signal protein [Candidatus Eisenbacteria bacterium]